MCFFSKSAFEQKEEEDTSHNVTANINIPDGNFQFSIFRFPEAYFLRLFPPAKMATIRTKMLIVSKRILIELKEVEKAD